MKDVCLLCKTREKKKTSRCKRRSYPKMSRPFVLFIVYFLHGQSYFHSLQSWLDLTWLTNKLQSKSVSSWWRCERVSKVNCQRKNNSQDCSCWRRRRGRTKVIVKRTKETKMMTSFVEFVLLLRVVLIHLLKKSPSGFEDSSSRTLFKGEEDVFLWQFL